MSFWYGPELLIGGGVTLLGIAAPAAAPLIQLYLGEAARTVIVQVGVEVSHIEALDAMGVFTANMSVAQVLANDRSVLALHQGVIRAAVGPRSREFYE